MAKKDSLAPVRVIYDKAIVKLGKLQDTAKAQEKEVEKSKKALIEVAKKNRPMPQYEYRVIKTTEKHPDNGKIEGLRITRTIANADDYLAFEKLFGDLQGWGFHEVSNLHKIPPAHETSFFVYHAGGVLFEQPVTADDRRRANYRSGYSGDHRHTILLKAPIMCTEKEYRTLLHFADRDVAAKIPVKFLK